MVTKVDLREDVTGALDAADRLMLDEAGGALDGAIVVVLSTVELAAAVASRGAKSVRVSDDTDPSTEPLTASLFTDASVVLLRLPKSLSALDARARLVAASAPRGVVVFAGGRLKYMTTSMNEVLRRSFARLDVSLARQKSRVLTAREPLAVAASVVERRHLAEFDLWIGAAGGVFAGAAVDTGTRTLLAAFNRLPDYETAVDFGCGTGILAARLKRDHPQARVIASDVSAAAVESARATAEANGLDFEVVRDNGLASQPDASVDLIVLNPPFHDGGAISVDTAHDMFREASRALRPGGQLWTVWNSHLGYTSALVRTVGPTVQIARNPKFTVTASTRAADSPQRIPGN